MKIDGRTIRTRAEFAAHVRATRAKLQAYAEAVKRIAAEEKAAKARGYSILELLFVLAILLTLTGLGAWKFMKALQAVSELLALLK